MDMQDRLSLALLKNLTSKKVAEVKFLPSLLIPDKITIPLVREAATRLQAHAIVIYKTQSNIFDEWRLFQNVKIRSYATCEYVLLDTKTGIILSSDLVTKKVDTEKLQSDLDNNEAFLRAETEAIEQALVEAAKDVSAFLDSGNVN
jgi:hypothetical protein